MPSSTIYPGESYACITTHWSGSGVAKASRPAQSPRGDLGDLPPSGLRYHECLPQAVLAPSIELPQDTPTVQGWNFDNGCDLDSLLGSMLRTGCQASALGQAIVEVERMVTALKAAGLVSVPQASATSHQCYLCNISSELNFRTVSEVVPPPPVAAYLASQPGGATRR